MRVVVPTLLLCALALLKRSSAQSVVWTAATNLPPGGASYEQVASSGDGKNLAVAQNFPGAAATSQNVSDEHYYMLRPLLSRDYGLIFPLPVSSFAN